MKQFWFSLQGPIWCVQLFISILTDSVSGQKMTIENTSGILPVKKHQIKTNISLFCSFSNLLSSVSLCKSSWLAMKNSTSTLVRESNQSGWINTNMSSRRSNRLRRRETIQSVESPGVASCLVSPYILQQLCLMMEVSEPSPSLLHVLYPINPGWACMEHVTRENTEKSFLIYVVNFPRISLDYVMLCRQYNRDNMETTQYCCTTGPHYHTVGPMLDGECICLFTDRKSGIMSWWVS